MKSSWKTTGCGIGMILSGVGAMLVALGKPLVAYLDDSPDTVADPKVVYAAIMTGIAMIVGGVGLLKARDNDKSSEDVDA